MAAGYTADFATPSGISPTMDKQSDSVRWFKDAQEYLAIKKLLGSLKQLKTPLALASLNKTQLAKYSAIFLPGGHAPMSDLYKDQELGRILRYFHTQQKPTALICHAPVALLSAKAEDGSWPYQGYNLTVFSTEEEQVAENNGTLNGHLTYYAAEALSSAGANVQVAKPWTGRIVLDRELITGQNPMSVNEFADALLEDLSAKMFSSSTLKNWMDNKSTINTNYAIVSTNLDFKNGYSTFYIGSKKRNTSVKEFSLKIKQHISQVRDSFIPLGLRGYLAYVGNDYEVAYLNWPDKASADAAFASASGKAILSDAQTFLENIVFKDAGETAPILK
jgi:putative intracellular protease/amidase